MKTGIYLAMFILISAFCACEKDDDTAAPPPPPSPQSRYDILTSHYWRNSSFSARIIGDINLDGIPDTTYYNDFPDPCMADDKSYFKSNGYMFTDDGANVCQFSTDSVTWALATNDTEIIIDSIPFYIVSLTSSQLKISASMSAAGPPFITIDETTTMVYP